MLFIFSPSSTTRTSYLENKENREERQPSVLQSSVHLHLAPPLMAMFSCSARPTKLYAALPPLPAKHGTSHHSIMLTFPSSSKPKNNNSRVCIDLLSSSNNNPDDSWGYWRTNVSFFQFFSAKSKDVKSLKQQLLEAIAPLDRGAVATPQDQKRVDEIAQELEAVNDIKEPFKSNLLNGKWELLYTTSQSILKTKRPKFLRSNGKIYQAINADTLRAQNMETWPFFNQATANLVPLNTRRVAVKFDFFRIAGLIPIKSPGSGRGQLEITYLDEELRISRGDRGNLFVLKMADPSYRVPL
uniref:Plastid lipid-associated protein/fibrillin conserved domain-containing protein n=2 Tax=Populus trichocarpa TaxID=3694 RepID=A0A2K2B092_POPTR|eukprot:XP_002303164.3 probable plastid-lipid-associated protein 4, chloroplastic isoform X1 [Populus trichocarpa]